MQEKIKEYLKECLYIDYAKESDLDLMAKDITEIVNVEYNKKFFEFVKTNDRNDELEKENELLKSKLINYNPTKQLELEEKINMLKAKCFRLRQTRMAYQSLADKRRDYANHISTTLHIKNLKIKELNQRVAKLELDRILKLDRDKIIEVLTIFIFNQRLSDGHSQKYVSDFSYRKPVMIDKKDIEFIADEIMKGN